MTAELPIEAVVPKLRLALRASTSVVLQAPPGAGKTTRVPLALLDEPWLAGRRIVMLEPRRLAARAAARRMADVLGEGVGGTVGYRVRMDSRVGPRTRVEVVTEGILTRMLQHDPALEGVGLVVFDEFHERSLHADLGLTLALQTQALLRDDLRVLVMSATLDGRAVAELLGRAGGHASGAAPVVTSEGRAFSVETRYLPHAPEVRVEAAVARTVRESLRSEPGDVLVFLPGAGEIRRAAELLADDLPAGVRLCPLYGDLPQPEQDRAIAPSPSGSRKVVLATAIAETSLTIEGVRVVVDSGLMRVPRFSPRTGMTRLETVPVSQASAEQRRGRAGRLGPGVCYRLWSEAQHAGLTPRGVPEILSADLAPLALELAAWGVTDPLELCWLDPPPAAAFAQARELLSALGALRGGAVTPHGRAMAELGLHPRLAHLLLRGREIGHGALACELAALLGERDPLRTGGGAPDADIRLRLEALRRGPGTRQLRGHAVDAGALHRVGEEARHWRRRIGVGEQRGERDAAGVLLAFAYPDRIARRRGEAEGRFLLRNGRGAAFGEPQPLSQEAFLAVAEVGGGGRESRIHLAAPLTLDDIREHFVGEIETEEVVAWDQAVGAVRARRRERLGALVLADAPASDPNPESVYTALLNAVRGSELQLLPWTAEARRLQQRFAFLHRLDPAWPDGSDAALLERLDQWLGPHLWGARTRDDLNRLDLAAALLGMLSWEQRAALDELAPSHLSVPSGSRIAIDYGDPSVPVLAVRLQEMFGLAETPRIARGRVPLTLHLLSPAQRPVQVTRDLASFWSGAYFEVRKDLRGRYPRHHWPEDPMQAEPTRRTRPR